MHKNVTQKKNWSANDIEYVNILYLFISKQNLANFIPQLLTHYFLKKKEHGIKI